MASSTVSARMSATKKRAGNLVLEQLGSNASAAVNDLYDYLIEKRAFPWQRESVQGGRIDRERLAESLAWVDSLQVELADEFATMSTKEARAHRLASESTLGKRAAR